MNATVNSSSREPASVQIIRMVREDLNKFQLANFWWRNQKSPSPGRYGIAWDSTRGQFLLSRYHFDTQTWDVIGRTRSLPDLLVTFFD